MFILRSINYCISLQQNVSRLISYLGCGDRLSPQTRDRLRATKDRKFMTIDGEMVAIDEIFEGGLDLAIVS